MDRLKLTECLFNLICKEESIMATAAHLPASPPPSLQLQSITASDG